ncbi:MAG: 2-hydroxychromene-2-carboxylate isomerase, partial [Magnetospirillum sp.]
LADRDQGVAKRYAQAVYHAYFAENRDISELAVATQLATRLGIDAMELEGAVQSPVWKQRLKDETEAAIAAGVFGSPFFVIDGEGFWGADRLPMIDDWLRTGGW